MALGKKLKLGIQVWKRWLSNEGGRRVAALWGNGDYGRLGLGSLNSQWRPVVCSAFDNQSIRAIACGGAHTLFLTEMGHVFASGLNDFGQLGVSNDIRYTIEPIKISGFPKEIRQIAAGHHHSCAITVNGELYTWGKNSSGQLGLGKREANVVPMPTKVECLFGLAIKMAALGSEHSVALTVSGEALSWGNGGSGQLGHCNGSRIKGIFWSNSEYTPRLIKMMEGVKVTSVAAGLLHSACIDENGSVFILGQKAASKMGFGGGNNASIPSAISKLPYCQDVACGGYHTCAIANSGELYTWGSNENGCLGIGSIDVSHEPVKVQGPFSEAPVSQVSCGWKHTAVISEGNIFTWGWGGSNGTFTADGFSSGGQLGHGDDVDHIRPMKISFGGNVKALQVSCGFNHTGAVLELV